MSKLGDSVGIKVFLDGSAKPSSSLGAVGITTKGILAGLTTPPNSLGAVGITTKGILAGLTTPPNSLGAVGITTKGILAGLTTPRVAVSVGLIYPSRDQRLHVPLGEAARAEVVAISTFLE